ncbi:MAG: MFS transporter [Chloroflexi bacterium]|jgi:MFS family permease|nr:MFS transporter [Chloroflexota bacterium]MBT5626696.1 MFS transporter [Chloroflexota bacterium]
MLWFGMVLSMGGFQMQMLVRTVLVYDLSDDRLITGLVTLGFAPSLLLVSLYGGVLSDRMERRLLIQVAQTVNGLLAGGVALLIITDNLAWGHLFAVSVIQGAMFALQMPARQAAIPSMVGKENLANAFALNAMAMSLMSLIAPALGGWLYGQIDPEGVYLVVAVTMLVSVVFTSMVPKMYPPVAANADSVVQNVVAGFRYIKNNKIVLNLMIYSVIVALLSMPFRMMIPVYGKDIYGSDAAQVGILLTAVGLGGVIGSISVANLRSGHRRGWFLLGGAIVSGASLGLVAGLPVFVAGLIGMIGIGLGEQARWALGQSLIMESTADEYRARVMSVLMMTFGLMPLGVYPMALAMDYLGGQVAVGISAVLMLIFAVVSISFLPRLRNLR